MTTVMPRPFESIKWGLESVSNALESAQGDVRISQEDLAVFKNFEKSFKEAGPDGRPRNQMRDAMMQEIKWLHDGRSFPFAPGSRDPKFTLDATEERHLKWASSLQNDYRAIAATLARADGDLVLTHEEAQNLKALIDGIQTSMKTLVSGVEHMREDKNNRRPAFEVLQTVKNIVNDTGNDIRGGPFGLWTKFGKEEAEAFVQTLGWQVTDHRKAQEVMQMLYDTAASKYGDIVIDQAAADVFANAFNVNDENGRPLDNWNKAVGVEKEEHPIVALYAVVIDEAITTGNTNVRELEVMLNAGRAAVNELNTRNSFVLRGPRALEGEVMPAGTAAVAGSGNRARRAELVTALTGSDRSQGALDRLQEYIDQLKSR